MGGACFTSCGRDKWPQLGGWAVGVHVNASGPFSPASLTWVAAGWVAEKNCICLAKLHFDRVCVIYSFGHRARCAIDVCRSDMAHRLWHVHRVAASPWRPSETPGERNAHPLTRPKRGSVVHNSTTSCSLQQSISWGVLFLLFYYTRARTARTDPGLKAN